MVCAVSLALYCMPVPYSVWMTPLLGFHVFSAVDSGGDHDDDDTDVCIGTNRSSIVSEHSGNLVQRVMRAVSASFTLQDPYERRRNSKGALLQELCMYIHTCINIHRESKCIPRP